MTHQWECRPNFCCVCACITQDQLYINKSSIRSWFVSPRLCFQSPRRVIPARAARCPSEVLTATQTQMSCGGQPIQMKINITDNKQVGAELQELICSERHRETDTQIKKNRLLTTTNIQNIDRSRAENKSRRCRRSMQKHLCTYLHSYFHISIETG